jgi:PAS domain S-box-containing protein
MNQKIVTKSGRGAGMQKYKVAIVGAGKGGHSIYRMLKKMEEVEIIGIADINPAAPGITAAQEDGVFVTTNYIELARLQGLDIIIEVTGNPDVKEHILRIKHNYTAIMESQAANLMMIVLKEKEEIAELTKIQGELSAILNSMQEAIEVADINGTIKYVNPAFSRITGIPEKERIGQNIFESSPDGALAHLLKTGKMVFGQRTRVGGSNAEVVANSAPIIVDGKMEGGVVVFQHFTDIMNMMEELKKSTTIIENLTDKLGQVTTSK